MPDVITDHVLSNKLDILAITETWLTPKNGDEFMLNLCSTGYATESKDGW